MSATKNILKRYYGNLYAKDSHAVFVSWLLRKKDDPKVQDALEEIWNNTYVTPNSDTLMRLEEVKERLGISSPAAPKNSHRTTARSAGMWMVAACVAALVGLGLFFSSPWTEELDRQGAFAQLEAMDPEAVSATTVIVGERVLSAPTGTIRHTRDGGMVVGDREICAEELRSGTVKILVPKGKRASVDLADGTKVWINSGTKLIYPGKFARREREVYLDGEVYLDVARDEERPFTVNATDTSVKVLGTQFNVRSYGGEAQRSVVLVEGRVEVESLDGVSKEVLQPGQAIISGGGEMIKRDVNVGSYIYWKTGELRLEGETPEEIFDKLGRYYGVEIVGSGDVRAEKLYRGRLLLGDSLEEVLGVIAVGMEFGFRREGDVVTIDAGRLRTK